MMLYEVLGVGVETSTGYIKETCLARRSLERKSLTDWLIMMTFPTYTPGYAHHVLSDPQRRRAYDMQSDAQDGSVAMALWW